MTDLQAVPATRRRGKILEAALLEAAWEELAATGYAGFTIEGVAARAGTSRPVIYRRWADRQELVVAAVRHHHQSASFPAPDTGSLRTDLIALLKEMTTQRMDQVVLFSLYMGEFFAETGKSLEYLRAQIMTPGPGRFDTVVDRAIARGEIDPVKLTPRVRSLPTDLWRHQLLMTLKPISEEDILAIVDEIFLPLVRSGQEDGHAAGLQKRKSRR